MAESNLRGSWDGKIEAQGGLGVAKPNLRRASGSVSGWSGVWSDLFLNGSGQNNDQDRHHVLTI